MDGCIVVLSNVNAATLVSTVDIAVLNCILPDWLGSACIVGTPAVVAADTVVADAVDESPLTVGMCGNTPPVRDDVDVVVVVELVVVCGICDVIDVIFFQKVFSLTNYCLIFIYLFFIVCVINCFYSLSIFFVS